ncbi:MAG: hypothetical protein ACTHU0_02210 [Kofleriaceae bacterium]
MRSLCLVLSLWLFASPAAADGQNPIVLESYPGPRPDTADRTITQVLDELAGAGYFAGTDVVGRNVEKQSRPATGATAFPADFAKQVARGENAFFSGSFSDAEKLLSPLVALAHAHPKELARTPALRDDLLKAMIALALSQQKLGDPSATRVTFGEIVRSFPGATLSRATYGPDAFNLFEQVRKDLAASGTGRLAVRIVGGTGGIYINERFENMGSANANLVPGDYRVFVKVDASTVSRVHRVMVKANETSTLTIQPGLDAVVQVTPTWTGMQFESSAARLKLEGAYARSLGLSIGATSVAVVGIDVENDKPVVFGALINMQTGADLRRASVSLSPTPSPDTLRALARFVTGDNTGFPGLNVKVAREPGAPEAATGEPSISGVTSGATTGPSDGGRGGGSGAWRGWKYLTGGAAIAAFGASAIYFYYDGKCTTEKVPNLPCPENYNMLPYAIAWLGGGVAMSAVTGYLLLRSDGTPARRTAFIVPTDGGAFAGYAARF